MYISTRRYTVHKTILTVLKSRRECFWVSRLISLSCNAPRFRCTCTSVDNSCRPDNPDRYHLEFNNDSNIIIKINKLFVCAFRVSAGRNERIIKCIWLRRVVHIGSALDLGKRRFYGQFAEAATRTNSG